MKDWKLHHNQRDYVNRFYEDILYKLHTTSTYYDLLGMADGKTPVLLCYEKPSDFCHRHIVSTWFSDYGYSCKEYK